MGDKTIETADKLHVVLQRISTEDVAEEAFVVGVLHDSFSVWEGGCGCPLILPLPSSSSRGPSQLADSHGTCQTTPVSLLLEDSGSVEHRNSRQDLLLSPQQATQHGTGAGWRRPAPRLVQVRC
ncbi:hypothetical protein ACOMHN_029405 [Nucella lapillus]